jgi:tetratricopeptide (TPR) repeat protein
MQTGPQTERPSLAAKYFDLNSWPLSRFAFLAGALGAVAELISRTGLYGFAISYAIYFAAILLVVAKLSAKWTAGRLVLAFFVLYALNIIFLLISTTVGSHAAYLVESPLFKLILWLSVAAFFLSFEETLEDHKMLVVAAATGVAGAVWFIVALAIFAAPVGHVFFNVTITLPMFAYGIRRQQTKAAVQYSPPQGLFDAFISYSHAKDKPIASSLQSAVQKLGKPWHQRRAVRVFRDDTSLSATPHLWPSIEQALDKSRFFVLLASPEAAASKWVNKEVAHWLEHRSVDTLLIGLTDGELSWDDAAGDFVASKTHPLPLALAGTFQAEPKWVDLRPYRDGADKHDARFTELAADFAAAIRGMQKEDLLSQEVRQQRHALRLAASAAAALLVLAIAATWEGILADREARRAEATLAAATQTANQLIFDLAQRFRTTNGIPAQVISDVLNRARGLLEQLIKSGQVTPDLKRAEATALNEIFTSLITSGDTKGALSAAEQARQIFADLLAQNPRSTDYQYSLAGTYQRIGLVQTELGDLADALKSYRAGAAIAERLMQSDPGNKMFQRGALLFYKNVGEVQKQQSDFTGALQSYRDGLAIAERLAQSDPGNTVWQGDLAASYRKIGDVQEDQSDLAGALPSFQNAVAVYERVTKAEPGNSQWQLNLAATYRDLGRVQEKQGNLASALQYYRDDLAIVERLVQSDPDNALWQRELAHSYINLGDVQVAQGELAAALKSYRDGLAIDQRLTQSDPNNASWQRDLSIDYERIGDVQMVQGNFADALSSYQADLGIAERLAQSDPGNFGWQHDLAESYNKVGDVQVAQGNFAGGLKSYQAGFTISARLVALAPSNKQWQDYLWGTAFRLVLARDFAGALDAADQAISRAPNEIWLYINRAHALMFLGHTDEARALYLKYRDQTNVENGKSWSAIVLGDFVILRKAGLANPLMDEIEKLFTSAG